MVLQTLSLMLLLISNIPILLAYIFGIPTCSFISSVVYYVRMCVYMYVCMYAMHQCCCDYFQAKTTQDCMDVYYFKLNFTFYTNNTFISRLVNTIQAMHLSSSTYKLYISFNCIDNYIASSLHDGIWYNMSGITMLHQQCISYYNNSKQCEDLT